MNYLKQLGTKLINRYIPKACNDRDPITTKEELDERCTEVFLGSLKDAKDTLSTQFCYYALNYKDNTDIVNLGKYKFNLSGLKETPERWKKLKAKRAIKIRENDVVDDFELIVFENKMLKQFYGFNTFLSKTQSYYNILGKDTEQIYKLYVENKKVSKMRFRGGKKPSIRKQSYKQQSHKPKSRKQQKSVTRTKTKG
jgi:hypothetical protein